MPSLDLVVAINHAVREADEWFDDPDDLDRVARVLASVEDEHDPVVAAGLLASRLALAQGFAEGNKRTGLLVARWTLDRNDVDAVWLMPVEDPELADLLVQAASGQDVDNAIVALFDARRT